MRHIFQCLHPFNIQIKKRLLNQNCMPKSLPCNFFISYNIKYLCRIIQCSSVAQLCLTLCNHMTATHQASSSITNLQSLLRLMPIKLVMPPNYLILCPSLLLSSIFPSIGVFSSESALHIRCPK